MSSSHVKIVKGLRVITGKILHETPDIEESRNNRICTFVEHREKQDAKILNQQAKRLNRETKKVLPYQNYHCGRESPLIRF